MALAPKETKSKTKEVKPANAPKTPSKETKVVGGGQGKTGGNQPRIPGGRPPAGLKDGQYVVPARPQGTGQGKTKPVVPQAVKLPGGTVPKMIGPPVPQANTKGPQAGPLPGPAGVGGLRPALPGVGGVPLGRPGVALPAGAGSAAASGGAAELIGLALKWSPVGLLLGLTGDSQRATPSAMPAHQPGPKSNVTSMPKNTYPQGFGVNYTPRTPKVNAQPSGMPVTTLPKFGVQPINVTTLPPNRFDLMGMRPGIASGPYANIPDGKTVAAGKDFTAAQKRKIYEENMSRNGGVLRDDVTGEVLVWPTKSRSGVTPPTNEAQVDHIFPRSPLDPQAEPGSNSFSNAQVRSRANNRTDTNKWPK